MTQSPTAETFVFEGSEVRKTGRTASKDIAKPNGQVLKTAELVEITPVDETDGWKKWVDPKLLFIVQ